MLMSFSCDWSMCCYLFWLRGMMLWLTLSVLGSQPQLGPWWLCFLPLTFAFELVWLQKWQVRKTIWSPWDMWSSAFREGSLLQEDPQGQCWEANALPVPQPWPWVLFHGQPARAGYWLMVQHTIARGKNSALSQPKNWFGKPPPEPAANYSRGGLQSFLGITTFCCC